MLRERLAQLLPGDVGFGVRFAHTPGFRAPSGGVLHVQDGAQGETVMVPLYRGRVFFEYFFSWSNCTR